MTIPRRIRPIVNPTGDTEVLDPTKLSSSISILEQCCLCIHRGRVNVRSNALADGPGVQPAGNSGQDDTVTVGLAIVVDLSISCSVCLEDGHVVPAGSAGFLDRRVGINK